MKASGKKIGDTVSFAANDASSSNQSAKDQFADGDYTITAEVLDPTDVSSDSTVNAFRAASTADYKFYVSEDAATSSSYSAVHVVVEGAKSLNSYSMPTRQRSMRSRAISRRSARSVRRRAPRS